MATRSTATARYSSRRARSRRSRSIGSQSLRKLELEERREIGVLIREPAIVRQLSALFEEDWTRTETGRKEAKKAEKAWKKDGRESDREEAAAS